MKTPLFKRLFILSFLTISSFYLFAQMPVFISVTPNTTSPAKLDKFELNISLTAGYSNAYDYDDIRVQCTFTAPGGRQDVVDGFYMQEYALVNNNPVPSGSGTFKIRYAPNEPGLWSYVVSCTNLVGSASWPAQTFECANSASPGFIRKNATNYLGFDNGAPFIPIGENIGWQNGNVVTDYTNWLTKLTDNGGNFIRVWMSSWAFALEWKNGVNSFSGLKKYKQTSAFYLDWLLDYCRQKNVYLMLELNNHGQVSTNVNPEWNDNPYNAANGGPSTNTWDFFTNVTAKAFHKNRLRYIIARYGYSQNIQSWELFNELHWTNEFETHKNELTAWDDEMSTYIKSKDVYKHLVTTSYGGTEINTNTWNLANIDFTQTHFYNNSPAIETILAAANQSFISAFSKPTLNGEFGLGLGGADLSADDPNGVHIHNAIWGSMFSGGLGTAMTWWWDNYIEPRNLYYHFKPLSSVVSLVNFKNDNYKKISATTTGGGTSDLTISPGAGFAKAPASAFTIDAQGNLTPDANQLSAYMFGNLYNTQNRNPPTFQVTYPVNGEFKVVVTAGGQGTLPKINISLDGAEVLNQDVLANTTYSINVPAGTHTIKVDNLGTDWFNVSNYLFTNIGSPLSTYILKSANNFKIAGWALNNQYNWQYLKNHGNVAPPAVQGSSISIPGMQNGAYTVRFYSTSTGSLLSSANIPVNSGQLTVTMPDIAWDIAFTATESSALPVQLSFFNGERINKVNHLHFNITESKNVKEVYIERSSNGNNFTMLKLLSAGWAEIRGTHNFIDVLPLKGNNFYRLKIIDNDGLANYSSIVKLINNAAKYSLSPNPFKDHIKLMIEPGKYRVQITDQSGRVVLNKAATSTNDLQVIKLNPANLRSGLYFLKISDEQGRLIGTQKMEK